MRILTVFGTRPEAIKMAPLVRLAAATPGVDARVAVTGQHREMLDQVLELFGIAPAFDLQVMQPAQDLAELTSRVLLGMRGVLGQWRPDVVLVQGDTTTTFAAALAAFYQRVAVGHVEAGLRTGDKFAPWPEEMNRRLASCLADWHFAPTAAARDNLLREGVAAERIHVTGNTVIDALLETSARIDSDAGLRAKLDRAFDFLDACKPLVLVTGHRRENFGQPLEQVCRALAALARRGDVEVLYAVHLNPAVREPVRRILGGERVHLTEPLDYAGFVFLMRKARIIVSDSGGIQEEATALGRPVLLTRQVTERPEAVASGAVTVVGPDAAAIVAQAERLLAGDAGAGSSIAPVSPFGDGRAARRIIDILLAGV